MQQAHVQPGHMPHTAVGEHTTDCGKIPNVSSPQALDQTTDGTAARWATRSAKLGGGIAFAHSASDRQFHVVRCCWRSAAVLSVSQDRVAVRRAVCRAEGHFARLVYLHASLPIRTLLPGRHRKVFSKNFARLPPPAFPEAQKPRNQKARITASGHTGSRSRGPRGWG